MNSGQQAEAPKMKTRKVRSRKKPTTVEAPRTEEVVENTMSNMVSQEPAEIKVETPEPNKYAQKPKVGTPTLGRSPNYVETVGLGKLTVITANGNTDV
jgi:hypothetical protein